MNVIELPVPPCPSWCDPRYCEVTESEVFHQGAPVTVETRDATFELTLHRCDDRCDPGDRERPALLLLHLESKTRALGVGEVLRASVEIQPGEVPGLLAALAGVWALGGGLR